MQNHEAAVEKFDLFQKKVDALNEREMQFEKECKKREEELKETEKYIDAMIEKLNAVREVTSNKVLY